MINGHIGMSAYGRGCVKTILLFSPVVLESKNGIVVHQFDHQTSICCINCRPFEAICLRMGSLLFVTPILSVRKH
jgi:hypothetical protein